MRLLKRIFRFFFGIFRAIVWTVGLLTIAAVWFFSVAERPVPREMLNKLLANLSTETNVVDAKNASFGLREGVVLRNVRLLSKGTLDPEWFAADELRLSGGIRPDRPPREWFDTVVAHGIRVPSLPQLPTVAPTASPSNTVSSLLSGIPSMRFDLVDASFLGMRFKRVQGLFRQERSALVFEDARIEWPSDQWPEEVHGTVRFDPVSGHVEGTLAGKTLPDRIYPLLRLLEATGVERIARRFAFTTNLVEVSEVRFRVAPEERRTELRVTLAVSDCTYLGEPVKRANAVIVAEGPGPLTRIRIEPLVCERADGALSGNLAIDMDTSNIALRAQSDLPVEPLFRLLQIDFSPARYGVTFDPPPRLTAAGNISLEGDLDSARITGTLQASTAVVRRIPLQGLQCEFEIAANTYAVRNVRAKAAGGDVAGAITFRIPPGVETQVLYRTDLKAEHIDVESFCAQAGFTSAPPGQANLELALGSVFTTNHDRCLNGSGNLKLEKGMLGRVPLFAGLTEYMARNIPGVEMMVKQSEAQMPFAITNGVLYAPKLVVEGDVFSLDGDGTYSVPANSLDFRVQAGVFKRRSWLGQIIHVATLPFTKLLLEFRVRGPLERPVWEYRSVIERIADSVGDAVGNKKERAP